MGQWSTTLTLGGAGTLDGQLGVAHILLLGLDLAHLRLLGGQTALVVRSVHDAQRQERVAAELGTEIMVLDSDNWTNDSHDLHLGWCKHSQSDYITLWKYWIFSRCVGEPDDRICGNTPAEARWSTGTLTLISGDTDTAAGRVIFGDCFRSGGEYC